MNKRTVFCAALLATLVTPALAGEWRFVDGEAAWAYVAPTRDTVRQPVQIDPASNRVMADGWKQVGGEAGWLYVGPQSRNTREQVARAQGQRSLNVVMADGWKQVDGEAGWLYVGAPREARPTMEASIAVR